MKKDSDFVPSPNIEKLFQLITILKSGRWPIANLAKRLEASKSTVYRYIKTLEYLDFPVDIDLDNNYFMVKVKENSALEEELTPEEITFGLELAKLASRSPLKESYVRKLSRKPRQKNGDKPKLFMRGNNGKHIELLARAIERGHQAALVQYQSPNSNAISDRLIEPIRFGDNYETFLALDTKDLKCKLFKIERIGEVIVKRICFKHKALHKDIPVDIFGYSGITICTVTLHLSLLAWRLLIEEYPASEPYTKVTKDYYEFKGPISHFSGIGRFVMGLPNDITIIGPQELKDFVGGRMKEQRLI